MTAYLQGIPAANGYAFGKAYEIIEPDLSFEPAAIQDAALEIARFHQALQDAENEIQMIKDKVLHEQGEENARIFDAQILVLHDPELIRTIENDIKTKKITAEQALEEETQKFIALFEQLEDTYMRERASDIKDVKRRILSQLLQKPLPNLSLVSEDTIIVAKDLTPSDTAQMNKQFIKGFVTEIGGRTSHSAIMARTLEIPAIVGAKDVTAHIKHGDSLIVDGIKGILHIRPSEEMITAYEKKYAKFEEKRATWQLFKHQPTVTADEAQIKLAANIGSPQDMDAILQHDAEGIGLYRTEFLYMKRGGFPTEDEQYTAYRTVLEKMKNKPVVIRTLDIGGDKQLDYWDLPVEANPFLGLRAVRLALKNESVFRTQLRALLRASIYGDLKIMFPMIATMEEFQTAKNLYLEEKNKLLKKNTPVSESIEIGMMIEIPSAALMAEQFAKEVDFFSVGTNDLIQYTFAADRMNESVAYLYQPYHPAILHLIKMVIDAAKKYGKWVGMCGEMAGDITAIPLLIGLGLDDFSMNASSILPARSHIKQLKKTEMKQLAEKALMMSSNDEVLELIQHQIKYI